MEQRTNGVAKTDAHAGLQAAPQGPGCVSCPCPWCEVTGQGTICSIVKTLWWVVKPLVV